MAETYSVFMHHVLYRSTKRYNHLLHSLLFFRGNCYFTKNFAHFIILLLVYYYALAILWPFAISPSTLPTLLLCCCYAILRLFFLWPFAISPFALPTFAISPSALPTLAILPSCYSVFIIHSTNYAVVGYILAFLQNVN